MSKAKEIATALGQPTKSGLGWMCSCPCHEDNKASLSVWETDNGSIAVNCFAGCKHSDIIFQLEEHGFVLMVDNTIHYYDYDDEAGCPLYIKVKKPGKTFYIDWVYGNTCRKVLYNTYELQDWSEEIFIVEGEKDCDCLVSNDLLGVCNFDGAGKWRPEYTEQLAGRTVFIIPDNDVPGNDHAELVYNSIKDDVIEVAILPIEELFKVVGVTKLWKGADISDWFQNGGTKDLLLKFANKHISKTDVIPINEVSDDCLRAIENRILNKGTLSGMATGFNKLDNITDGFQDEDMIILASRPSMGKTALMLNIVQHCSIENDQRSLIFSAEMSKLQVGLRIIANMADIWMSSLRSGMLTDEETTRMYAACEKLADSIKDRVLINDTCGITIDDLIRQARIENRKRSVDAIMVDYIQLLRGTESRTRERYLEIGEISSKLKGLAQELSIPVIVLSQLSRAVEQRQNKRPLPSDLRESGSIEQDADIIMFLYRDEVYNPDTMDKGIAELIISKHRNGPLGLVRMGFEGPKMRFSEDLTIGQGATPG